MQSWSSPPETIQCTFAEAVVCSQPAQGPTPEDASSFGGDLGSLGRDLGGTWGLVWVVLRVWRGQVGSSWFQECQKDTNRGALGVQRRPRDHPICPWHQGLRGCTKDAPRMRYVSSYAPAVPLGQHYRLKGKNSSVLIEVV